MALALAGYPTLTDRDRAWIQTIRSEHDQLFDEVIDPHFPLVFPIEEIEEEPFREHVAEVLSTWDPISFTLRCAAVWDDVATDYFHVFLIPDEGLSEMVRLHDRLYTGPLKRHLRVKEPFIPHLGVGNSLDPWQCRRIARDLNEEDVQISGRIERLTLLDYQGDFTGGMVARRETLPLG